MMELYYYWIIGFYFGTLIFANGLIDRDLLLTPKEGLQIDGKSVFYQEPDSGSTLKNQSTDDVAWERTLKHVIFVTLFPGSVHGNLSQSKEYNDFLQTPYIREHEHNHLRFGDIITLARGRLEKVETNRTLRLVEGLCDLSCDENKIIALWQVQKIRHRDVHRKFRYEMKFSVKPFNSNSQHSDHGKRETNVGIKSEKSKSFILKDDDYPRSFLRLNYDDNETQRRSDDFGSRNFRQISPPFFRKIISNDVNEVRPKLKEFSRDSLPLESPLLPEKLNIGEYIKDHPRATNKIGLFPLNLSGLMTPATPTPTTNRPNYYERVLKPNDLMSSYQKQSFKFPDILEEELIEGTHTPIITHHFHHHYYMPSPENSATENFFASDKETGRFTATTGFLTPSPPEVVANIGKINVQHLPISTEGRIENVPKPDIGKQFYRMLPIKFGFHEYPLLIYPPLSHHGSTRSQMKPFIQSEPDSLNDEIRYSDPDPLYQNPVDANNNSELYESKSSQLESPNVDVQPKEFQQEMEFLTTAAEDENEGKVEGRESTSSEPLILNAPTPSEPKMTTPIPPTSVQMLNEIPDSTSTTQKSFLPTLTAAAHKFRYGYQRTTTEQPVLKWKAKRKTTQTYQLSTSPTNETNQTTTQVTLTSPISSSDGENSEKIETLTQKSVSKSISFKVGNQFKEIPVTEIILEHSADDKTEVVFTSNHTNSNSI